MDYAYPVIGSVVGQRACGHSDGFAVLRGEAKAATIKRRADWNRGSCEACAKAAPTTPTRPVPDTGRPTATPATSGPAPAAPKPAPFRLPDGAAYALTYAATDASHGLWRGTLTLPGGQVFACEDDGVHRLIDKLGKQWREAQPRATDDREFKWEASA